MLIFIAIIIIIVLTIVLNTREKQIKYLKEEIIQLKKQTNTTNISNYDMSSKNMKEETVYTENFKKISEVKQEPKSIMNEKERKNTIILITGAICIVLAALVFLMSTWNIMPDILKTVVLGMLIVVFLAGSSIAKNKFNLEKTSHTFFYIAMAYIPMCLFSISIFGLFGDYLSIYGEGKYLFLFISAIFVSPIYYLVYLNKNSKYMLYGSLLFQMLSIILFTLIFSNDIVIIGICLLLYNILLMLFTKDKVFRNMYIALPCIVGFIEIFQIYRGEKTLCFLILLLAINFLILQIKNNIPIFVYLFNICLIGTGIYFVAILDIPIENIYIYMLAYVVLVYIFENIILALTRKDNVYEYNSLAIITLVTIGIIYLIVSITENIESLEMFSYIFGITELILLIITYLRSKKIGKTITSILIPLCYMFVSINLVYSLELKQVSYIIFAFLALSIAEIFRTNIKINLGFLTLSFLMLFFIIDKLQIDQLMSAIFIATVFTTEMIIKKKEILSIVPLILLMPFVFVNHIYITDNTMIWFMVIITFVIYIISLSKRKISIFTVLSGVYLLFTIIRIEDIYIKNILFIVWSVSHLLSINEKNGKDIFKFLSYLSGLFLYNTIIQDIDTNDMIIFDMLGYVTVIILIFRTILNKYIKEFEVFESIVLGIIYIISIFMYYNDEVNSMVFIALIILIIMFSYIKKYGSLFVVNIVSLIINILILTREFWTSVPWWVYLLVIGSVLIAFAIRNEASEKKKRINIGSTIKSIKEKVDNR